VNPPTDSGDWLVYGANGYTARMILKEAIERGLRPVVAGRNRDEVELVAARMDCPARTFPLDDPSTVAKQLKGIRLVLNCAGPFSQTARTLIAACIEAKAHYLDITGEIDSIEHAAICDEPALKADISIIPAVGFDVVPTDCLAAMLAAEMPDATHLTLAFTGGTDASPGTTKTVLESLPHGARARIAGRIEKVPFAWKQRTIPFHTGPREAVTIGWGDVASAYYTTRIKNIDTYIALDEIGARNMRRLRRFGPLLRFRPLLKLANRLVDRFIKGPTPEALAAERSAIWGEVRNAAGETRTASLETPNGYRLTALTAVAAVERVLAGRTKPGFQTPAQAFGRQFILSIPGVAAISGVPASPGVNRPT